MVHFQPPLTLLRPHFNMQVNQPSKLSPVVQSALEVWSWRDLVSQGVPLQAPTPTHVLTMGAPNYGGSGGSVPFLFGKGCLVERLSWSPYQLYHLEEIPEVDVWNTCPSRDRQQH